jgi:hypothetical protein
MMSEDEFFRLRGLDATLYCRIMRGCRTFHLTSPRMPITVDHSLFLSDTHGHYASYSATDTHHFQFYGCRPQITSSRVHFFAIWHGRNPLFPSPCCSFLLDCDNLGHHPSVVRSRSVPVQSPKYPIPDYSEQRSREVVRGGQQPKQRTEVAYHNGDEYSRTA